MTTEQSIFNNSLSAIDVYSETARALEGSQKRPFQKVYNSLNTMLEECYFVGASKFGHNFIA
ncbi:MAG: hypothetical protein PHV37_02780 [Candidatus Gastranaerophilales bacterium]|nr:hypothetical protein [Candidatus Gastranaerophilales bacterium]